MPHKFESSKVHTYIKHLHSDPSHRYHSWNVFQDAFRSCVDPELLSLHLGFYLASWGMYRGSSGLLQKNHRIHTGAVKILRAEKYQQLTCNHTAQIDRTAIPLIMELKRDLSSHYTALSYTRQGNTPKKIAGTDTLLSKIILGAFGCMPAYDQYFITGLKAAGMRHTNFTANALEELFDFAVRNQTNLDHLHNQYNTSGAPHYPTMKMLDMYFWQWGFDLETINAQKNTKQSKKRKAKLEQ